MRPLTRCLIAVLLLAGTAACGTTQRPTAQQMEDFSGNYALSNGARARIFALDERLYVELARHRKEFLRQATPDLLAARDGSVAVRLAPDIDEDAIVLEYRPDLLDGVPLTRP